MAGIAAKIVKQVLEENIKEDGPKPELIREDLLVIELPFKGINYQSASMVVFFKFNEDDDHVHLEGMRFVKVPEDKFDAMYKVLNECNDQYTHIKFVLDVEKGELNARDDAVIQLDSCGAECFELMYRMLKVVEDAYPKFMKVVL